MLARQDRDLRRSRSAASSRRTPYWTALNHLPDMVDRSAVGQVAASGQRHAEDVSPGCSSAMKTAWLACAPEWGWTLA